jgi:uncharacterized membrane protein
MTHIALKKHQLRKIVVAVGLACVQLQAISLAQAAGSIDLLGASTYGEAKLSGDGKVFIIAPYSGTASSRVDETGRAVLPLPPSTINRYFAANAINNDGTVIVGYLNGENLTLISAVVWTQQNGTQTLAGMGGMRTYATAVSGDGNVIGGYSGWHDAQTLPRYGAMIWTKGQDGNYVSTTVGQIGTSDFVQGISTKITALNGTGSVAIGTETNVGTGFNRSFRWTPAGGIVVLNHLSGSNDTQALGVNTDGTVIVGRSGMYRTNSTAFRWVTDGTTSTMTPLGTIENYAYSGANAVDGAGNVVVGYATNSVGNPAVAVRWTQTDGMHTLSKWMTDNGVDTSAMEQTMVDATSISQDGNVVMGKLSNGHIFLARVAATGGTPGGGAPEGGTPGGGTPEGGTPGGGAPEGGTPGGGAPEGGTPGGGTPGGGTPGGGAPENKPVVTAPSGNSGGIGSGLIQVESFNAGLSNVAASTNVASSSADLVLHGMHGNPMQMLLADGKSGFWTAGDIGRQEHNAKNTDLVLGEIGYGQRFNSAVQMNIAAGYSHSKSKTDLGGQTRGHATYVMPEAIVTLPHSLYATVSAFYSKGKLDIDRGYLNTGKPVLSKGSPDTETMGLRLRLDWYEMATVNGVAFTPYLGLSYAQTKVQAYTETGGGFPARFDERKDKATTGRVGLDMTKNVMDDSIKLQGRLEGVHRFEKNGANTTGEVLGLSSFNFAGQALKQTWLRVGAGAEGKIGSGVASAMLNATTEGEAPSYWLAVTYRWMF